MTDPKPSLEEQLDKESAALLAERTKTSSPNPLVHILWLLDGVDLWHRTEGKYGHSIQSRTQDATWLHS